MPNDDTCETCNGDGVIIADAIDTHGERVDDEMPCPDCGPNELDEYELEAARESACERQFELGGEA